MVPLRRVSGFALRCAIVYAVCVAAWPVVGTAYRAAFRASGNLLFGTFGHAGAASFQDLPAGDHRKDTRIVLKKRRPPYPEADVDIPSSLIGYRPTVFIIALVLATPLPWSRRWRALVWSVVSVQAFVALRTGLLLLDSFSNPNALAIYSFGPNLKQTLTVVTMILFRSPAVHYMGPMFIWLIVTFRRGDLAALSTKPVTPPPTRSASQQKTARR